MCRYSHQGMKPKRTLGLLLFLPVICIIFLFSVFHEQIRKDFVHFGYSKWKEFVNLEHQQKFVSYCSLEADNRSRQQNVISYSLYGNFSDPKIATRYLDPLKMILKNVSQVYPGVMINLKSPSHH